MPKLLEESHMLPRIHALDPKLANQISAGEVIERPASIVKELLENSIDAHATKITVFIEAGGLESIRVRDDGVGIHPEDMTLALNRHATSKISSTEDLIAIRTLGFRGEALASIGSVSKLTLSSHAAEAEMGWEVMVCGTDELSAPMPAPHPRGTSVIVKHLFYNTPARKKFLRSTKTEWQAILEVITRIALSRYDIAFDVIHEEKRALYLPEIRGEQGIENKIKQRIGTVLSQDFVARAKAFDENITTMRLHGWLGGADFHRSTSDWQFFYVNGRIVKDRLIQHAIRQAYGEQLPPGRYAAYVVYLEIDPSEVDVNVHPTKHEVRFHHNRMVHDFIVKSIANVLNKPPIDISPFTDMTTIQETKHAVESAPMQVTPVSYHYHDEKNVVDGIAEHYKMGRVLTLFDNGVMITKTPTGELGVVNIHAALSCAILHNLQQEQEVKCKPLLVPEPLSTAMIETQLTENDLRILQRLGFLVESVYEKQYVVREVPAFLENNVVHSAITTMLQAIGKYWRHQESPVSIGDVLFPSLACTGAPNMEDGTQITRQMILAALHATEMLPPGTFCSHGLMAWKIYSPYML